MNTIPYAFTFQFEKPIWNTQIDPKGNFLTFEVRNETTHQTEVSCLNLKSMEWVFTGFVFEKEEWWYGVAAISANVIILYTFDNDDNPDEKSYFGLHPGDQNILWELSNWNFVEANENLFTGYNREGQLETRKIDSGELTEDELTPQPKPIHQPKFYGEENEHFTEFKTYIQNELNVPPVLGCDYLEFAENIIFSYYVRFPNGYDCNLVLIGPDGTIQFHERLETQLKGMIGTSFFIIEKKLLFIKNKIEICVYDLA